MQYNKLDIKLWENRSGKKNFLLFKIFFLKESSFNNFREEMKLAVFLIKAIYKK